MTGHQVVGMRPAGQSLHAVEPRADVLVLSRDVEAELLGRIIEIAGQRYVGDGRRDAQNVRTTRQALVENGQCAVGPALEEFHHRRMAGWFREVVQEAVGPERAADLLVVEDDPAQRFEALVVAARQEFSRTLGEISQDHAGLAELLRAVNEHRRFAHLVDVVTDTPLCAARPL